MTNNEPDYKEDLYFENNKIQTTGIDDTKTQANLTEQWKKGELKLGEHYYYTTIFSPNVYIQNFTRDVISFQDFKEIVAEVLAPVPSYDEWKYKCEICEMFAEENQSLRKKLDIERCKNKGSYYYDGSPMDFLAECERDKKQNAQLKELLKRVNEHFKWVDHDDPFYVKDELWDDIKKVLENNNEVLK